MKHRDFKCYVTVNYIGQIDANHRSEYQIIIGGDVIDDTDVRNFMNEIHELIYTDGCIAVTMFEYCYATWNVNSGKLIGGSLWNIGEYQLSSDSIKTIQSIFQQSQK